MFSILIATGLIVVLYFNRLEVKMLQLDNGDFEVTYFNQQLFGKTQAKFLKKSVNIANEKNIITLYSNGVIVAKMRKGALDNEDWETLESYFT